MEWAARMTVGTYDSLNELLDRVEERAPGGISIDTVQSLAGRGAFGPLILLPGLLAVSPLTGIPTVPTILGIIVAILSFQLMIGRDEIWLPERVRRARLNEERTRKALSFLRPIARQVDKVIKPRLSFATHAGMQRAAALICFLVAITMPPLEILPFLATTAGIVLTIFGLAITIRDGVLMIVGLCVFFGGLGGLAYVLLY